MHSQPGTSRIDVDHVIYGWLCFNEASFVACVLVTEKMAREEGEGGDTVDRWKLVRFLAQDAARRLIGLADDRKRGQSAQKLTVAASSVWRLARSARWSRPANFCNPMIAIMSVFTSESVKLEGDRRISFEESKSRECLTRIGSGRVCTLMLERISICSINLVDWTRLTQRSSFISLHL